MYKNIIPTSSGVILSEDLLLIMTSASDPWELGKPSYSSCAGVDREYRKYLSQLLLLDVKGLSLLSNRHLFKKLIASASCAACKEF